MRRPKAVFFLLFLMLLTLPVFAADEARSINESTYMTIYGERADTLTDANLRSHSKLHSGTELTIRSSELIGGLYLEFSFHPGEWTLLCGERTITCGQDGFLHAYIPDLNSYSLTLRFHGEGVLANVYALSPGERPDWVQDWGPAWDKADVLLLPTHSDDDALFFGGLIPWCMDKGARVQVAYLISHEDDPCRRSELLNGLWTSGLRHYPVLGEYKDLGASEDIPIEEYAHEGVSYEDMLLRTLRLYRQFRPQVVICHDRDGEYGHGAHKLYYQLAVDAVTAAGDSSKDASSAARWGVWTPKKLYTHLGTEGKVLIDLDEPLRSFDYQTGYELAQKSFACHLSQYDSFSWYFWGAPTAAMLSQYSSREYGLYYSSVGEDTAGNTFFENITLYDPPPSHTPAPSGTGEERVPESVPSSAPAVEQEPAAGKEEAAGSAAAQDISKEKRTLTLTIGALIILVIFLLGLLFRLSGKNGKKDERGTKT